MAFSEQHISLAGKVFAQAEAMAARYYRFTPERMKRHRYEVRTLAHLKEHERDERSFAQLCKYRGKGSHDEGKEYNLYRICLQDDRILDAVKRANTFIKLDSLLLYIAAHELVHVVRFEEGIIDFEASPGEKQREEEAVHSLTRGVLQPLVSPEIKLVFDCFSDKYTLEGIYN